MVGKSDEIDLEGRAPQVPNSNSENEDTAEAYQNILKLITINIKQTTNPDPSKLIIVDLGKTPTVCKIYIRNKLIKRVYHELIRPIIRRLERVYMDL